MRRGRSARRDFVAGSATALVSIGIVKAPARAAQFEWRAAAQLPADHPTSIRLTQMFSVIEQESGGRIRTQFFPNGQLGGDTAMFSQLRTGALHFLSMAPGNLAAVVPAADIGYLGFAYNTPEEGFRALDGPLGNYLRSETTTKGLHVMRTVMDGGMFQIGANPHPIKTPEDLRGLRIRTVESRITIDLFKALGATPVALTGGDVYTGLQTKLVDGEAAPLVTIETQHWYEVTKYVSLTNHQWSSLWHVVNGDAWSALPPDLQELVQRNQTKYALLERADNRAAAVAVIDRMTRQGLTFNRVDQTPFRAPLRPYFEYWANVFGATAWGLLQASLGRKLF